MSGVIIDDPDEGESKETVIITGVICLFAFVVTWLTRIDMTGRLLEELEEWPLPGP